MTSIGPGVERLQEEIANLFPQARLAVLSSDIQGSTAALKQMVGSIAAGDTDIIIGTQLVAKGHDFPNLTLVGVIDADLGLQGADLRAAERTFQTVQQVAGRAGRRASPGVAMIQTHQPDHPVIQALAEGRQEQFMAVEAEERSAACMPPFSRLAGIILSSPDRQRLVEAARELAAQTEGLREIGATVFGPAPAPMARLRGRHRMRFLVKAPRSASLQPALHRWVNPFRHGSHLRVTIDIDPQSFL